MSLLETGIKNVRNVSRYYVGGGSLSALQGILNIKRRDSSGPVIFFIDQFFRSMDIITNQLGIQDHDQVIYIDTRDEPTTEYVNQIILNLKGRILSIPSVVVGIGGGSTMDIAKAVSNLLTNGGMAEDYQGWDLLKVPGVYKIGIPTISGTGAEATRTCVMVNKATNLKLGMNSDFTVFDQIIMDPTLTATVPRDQYFFTGMDSYLHCVEALSGSYRNAIGDSFSQEAINLCRKVFLSTEMQSIENREHLMVASYLGGCAIATSYVGLIHPFSAALSVVFGFHHCVANCIVMRAMKDFYPEAFIEFWSMVELQNVNVPSEISKGCSSNTFELLYKALLKHEKPLTNALGENYKKILTMKMATHLFQMM